MKVYFSEKIVNLSYIISWKIFQLLPEVFVRKLFNLNARRIASNYSLQQLRLNLARITKVGLNKVPNQLILASLYSYARYWKETFCLPSMNLIKVSKNLNCVFIGTERLKFAHKVGKGGILALPHSGNWDMAGIWLIQHYGTFVTVSERLRPESLYRRFLKYRENLGFEVLSLSKRSHSLFKILTERLRDNIFVCLISDRDFTHTGVEINFFEEAAYMPAGPAKLAVETNSPLYPVHIYYKHKYCVIEVSKPIDTSSGVVSVITQKLANQFALNISAHPIDWHMLQPYWIGDLSKNIISR